MIPEETQPLPPRDHNRPPSLVETITLEQNAALTEYTKRRDELVAAVSRKSVNSRITAGDAGDLIRIARQVFEKIDADRLERSRPYRDAADRAKAIADEFWEPVEAEIRALRIRLKEWTDAEDKRIEDQQREQEQAMQQMREASSSTQAPPVSSAGSDATAPAEQPFPPPPAPVGKPAFRRRIRGDLGATVSTVEKWAYRVANVKKVPKWILDTPTVHNAIIQVVKSMAKHSGDIPGIERTAITDNQIR